MVSVRDGFGRGQVVRGVVVAAHLSSARARGFDRAVGGVGSGLRQEIEGDHRAADRGGWALALRMAVCEEELLLAFTST